MPPDPEPPSTVIYLTATDSSERKERLEEALKHIVNWWGLTWLKDYTPDEVINTIVGEMEPASAGIVTYEEKGFQDPPFHQLFVYYDHAGSDWALTRLVDDLSSGDVDSVQRVITSSPDVLVDTSRGVQMIEDLVVGAQVDVSFVEHRLVLQHGAHVDGARKRVVTTLCDSLHPRADDGEGYRHTGGRPPLGFEAKDGRLVPGDGYDEVCTVLQQVQDSKTSKREAAAELGCVRATISNALDRPQMYNLR